MSLTWSWAIAALLGTLVFYLLQSWPWAKRRHSTMRVFRLSAEHSLIRDTIACPICTRAFALDEEIALMPLQEHSERSYEPAHAACVKRALSAFERWGLTR